MVDLDSSAAGRFRIIELVTGEQLDLNKPDLGRPDGLELWDAAAMRTSHRHAPTARCLFPLCGYTGVVLCTLHRENNQITRYARHFPGEGVRVDHSVAPAAKAQHHQMLDVWANVFDHVGRPVVARERGLRGAKVLPDLRIDGPQPTSVEVQLSPTKTHFARTRKAAAAGVTAVWNSGPRVDLQDRVPELRFTTDIPEVLAERHPQDIRILGVRDLQWERRIGGRGFDPRPGPMPMRMGDICEQLPGGDLTPIKFGKYQILVPKAVADRYNAGTAAEPDPEEPGRRPRGKADLHARLAAQLARRIDADEEPVFASGPGSLAPCAICGIGTFRRRWDLAIHPQCESTLRPKASSG